MRALVRPPGKSIVGQVGGLSRLILGEEERVVVTHFPLLLPRFRPIIGIGFTQLAISEKFRRARR